MVLCEIRRFPEQITNSIEMNVVLKEIHSFTMEITVEVPWEELETIFDKLFPKGLELFSFIKEGYDKRISLVHAEPDWGAEWSPFLLADDFFEYFNICRELLNLILIDRNVEY